MTTEPTGPITFDDLLGMSGTQLQAIIDAAHPIDEAFLDGKQYTGSDLSLPKIGHKLLWETFRKTFVRDPDHGDLRGWNVRMEQRGIHGAQAPKRTKAGEPRTFAHYRVRSAEGIAWPKGWRGRQFLDYSIAGNPFPENLAYTPIVAVNEGRSDLILGWEIFKVGGRLVDSHLYWAIEAYGPLDHDAQPKKPPRL
jgi:hypothetical protein